MLEWFKRNPRQIEDVERLKALVETKDATISSLQLALSSCRKEVRRLNAESEEHCQTINDLRAENVALRLDALSRKISIPTIM